MNVQGCLAFTRTFRVEILSINKKITRWDDSLPSGRCRPSDKGGRGGGGHPDPEMWGGGGGLNKKKFSGPSGLRASVRSNNKGRGGSGLPRPLP